MLVAPRGTVDSVHRHTSHPRVTTVSDRVLLPLRFITFSFDPESRRTDGDEEDCCIVVIRGGQLIILPLGGGQRSGGPVMSSCLCMYVCTCVAELSYHPGPQIYASYSPITRVLENTTSQNEKKLETPLLLNRWSYGYH